MRKLLQRPPASLHLATLEEYVFLYLCRCVRCCVPTLTDFAHVQIFPHNHSIYYFQITICTLRCPSFRYLPKDTPRNSTASPFTGKVAIGCKYVRFFTFLHQSKNALIRICCYLKTELQESLNVSISCILPHLIEYRCDLMYVRCHSCEMAGLTLVSTLSGLCF